MLKVRDLVVHYGPVQALNNAFLDVHEGEIVAIIGGNGSGKSTMISTVAGMLKPTAGTIEFNGQRIDRLPADKMIKLGISMAPAGHLTFPDSTVYSNLESGAYIRKDRAAVREDIEGFFKRFPGLNARRNQKAGLLSGGEQQLLTISRALMSHPKLLLLDEPSIGLAPAMMRSVFDFIKQIRDEGVTLVIVEQNARQALAVADRAYVLADGEVVLHGSASEMMQEDRVRRAYFGGA
jgi:branched-chain amino acid transport system ATP-binding protein